MNAVPGEGVLLLALADFFFIKEGGEFDIGQYTSMLGTIA